MRLPAFNSRPSSENASAPALACFDRLFRVELSRIWNGWRAVLVYVQFYTVAGWQRERFRKFRARLSRMNRRRGGPAAAFEIRRLIEGMAAVNPLPTPAHGRRSISSRCSLRMVASRYAPSRLSCHPFPLPALLLRLLFASAQSAYLDSRKPVEERVRDLLSRMNAGGEDRPDAHFLGRRPGDLIRDSPALRAAAPPGLGPGGDYTAMFAATLAMPPSEIRRAHRVRHLPQHRHARFERRFEFHLLRREFRLPRLDFG
jgi:hypothetical protein